MKYFSEILNEKFDTEAALKEAEKKHAKLAASENTATVKASAEKKALAAEIDKADSALELAYDKLEARARAAKKIEDDYSKKIKQLEQECAELVQKELEPAKKAVAEALKNKYLAIEKFNEKYGIYRKLYTGDRAAQEFERIQRTIDSLFNKFFLF